MFVLDVVAGSKGSCLVHDNLQALVWRFCLQLPSRSVSAPTRRASSSAASVARASRRLSKTRLRRFPPAKAPIRTW